MSLDGHLRALLLSHHKNTIHKSNEGKWDSCFQDFGNSETLIEHTVHNHTGGRI